MLDPGQQPIVNENNLKFACISSVLYFIAFILYLDVTTALLAVALAMLILEGVLWLFAFNKISFAHICVRMFTSLLPVVFLFYLFANMLNMWE